MKKKFAALAVCISCILSAVPFQANALSPPIIGDINLDWNINISDLVMFQRFLHGNCELDMTFGKMPFDMNRDDKIDVFDYIILRNTFAEWNEGAKIERTFTRCAEYVEAENQYSKYEKEALITSVEELKNYLSPMNVMTTDGECYIFEVVSQSVYDDYMSRYDERFFAKNVLLLNFLKGVDEYTFVSTQYDTSEENNVFEIKYYNSSDPNLAFDAPLPPYIAEVSVPKRMWEENTVIKWTETEPHFEVSAKTDFTNAVTVAGIDYAIAENEPAVIKSPEELAEFTSDKFRPGIATTLSDTYSDKFFENNILVLDLYYQKDRDDFIVDFDVKENENGLEIIYDRKFINGFAESGMQINQIIIPKEKSAYEVSKSYKWQNDVDVIYDDFDMGMISESTYISIEKLYSKEGE